MFAYERRTPGCVEYFFHSSHLTPFQSIEICFEVLNRRCFGMYQYLLKQCTLKLLRGGALAQLGMNEVYFFKLITVGIHVRFSNWRGYPSERREV